MSALQQTLAKLLRQQTDEKSRRLLKVLKRNQSVGNDAISSLILLYLKLNEIFN